MGLPVPSQLQWHGDPHPVLQEKVVVACSPGRIGGTEFGCGRFLLVW